MSGRVIRWTREKLATRHHQEIMSDRVCPRAAVTEDEGA